MSRSLNGRTELRVLRNNHWVRIPVGFTTLGFAAKIEVKDESAYRKLARLAKVPNMKWAAD